MQGVAINTSGAIADNSSGLDIDFNNKGILVPRIGLTSVNDNITIVAPANSLLIYNTSTAGISPNNVRPGYYYWNGTKWISLSGGSGGNDWGLQGNSGTVDGTNFIGTTDNVPFTIKVNNQKSGYINPSFGLTFYGSQAGLNNVGSTANTAIGMYSLYTNTTGASNTGVGYASLYYNSTGTSNAAVGNLALYSNTTGFSNTATGSQSMMNNTTGFYNTGIGSSAMAANTTGNSNAAVGAFAMMFNTTGNGNAAFGYGSLPDNTTGNYNTALGGSSLRSNTTGSNNISIGSQNMWSNTIGQFNISIGNTAMFTNTSGSVNICIGTNSMSGVTTAYNNTIVGHESGNGNGIENSTVGYRTLAANVSGSQNTAIGSNALGNNSTGNYNTSTGYGALFGNGTGNNNTACGGFALSSCNGGNNNSALGYHAGYLNNYSQCTFVGSESNSAFFRTNITMLGFGITTAECTSDNQIMLGNTAITQIRSQVTGITSYSDKRFKKEIKEDVSGLDFVLKLKPVTYNEDPLELHKIWDTPDSLTSKINFNDIQNTRFIGFIAQDVEIAAKESGFNFPGIDIPKKENEVYTLRYVDFIMPIVKSIQEQQIMIDELKKQNDFLLRQLEELRN